MAKYFKTVMKVLVLCGALVGCHPQGPEFTEDYDIVLTYFKDNYDFASKNTYAIPDRIVKITGNLIDDDEPVFIPDVVAEKILARIKTNMTALGWQQVDISANPDVLLAPASWETTTINYYYDYWYWWWGGYYPGWGYPPVYATSYTTGTLVMTLIDPDVINANGNPVVQWTGAINGVMTGAYDELRINNAIDKAFLQSPYLKTN